MHSFVAEPIDSGRVPCHVSYSVSGCSDHGSRTILHGAYDSLIKGVEMCRKNQGLFREESRRRASITGEHGQTIRAGVHIVERKSLSFMRNG